MKAKYLFISFVLILFFSHGFKSKRFEIKGKSNFSKGKYYGTYLDETGNLGLTPSCERIFKLDEEIIWKVITKENNTYVATGHQGNLYKLNASTKKTVYSSSSTELTSMIWWGDTLLVGSGPKGIIYELKKNGDKLETFAILPATFIWDMVVYGDSILVSTGNDGRIYKINKRKNYSVFFRSIENNILKIATNGNDKVFASTSGQGYLYEIDSKGNHKILYDAGGRDINDFIVLNDKIYLVTAGKEIIYLNGNGSSKEKNSYFENVLVEVDLKGGFENLHTITNTTIPSIIDLDTNTIYFGTAEKGQIYSYDLLNGHVNMLYKIEDASIANFYKNDDAIYFSSGIDSCVYKVSPSYKENGKYVSCIFDTKSFSTWGQVNMDVRKGEKFVQLYARTGNSFLPDESWSEWSECKNSKISSDNARFIQLKVKLFSTNNTSPKISNLEINYSKKNTRPNIEYLQFGRNRKIEKRHKVSLMKNEELLSWKVKDPDSDRLNYELYYRSYKKILGEYQTSNEEDDWILLEEKIQNPYYIINLFAFPNGNYEFKLTASDILGNNEETAYTVELISTPILIDNVPPKIEDVNTFEDRIEFTVSDDDSVINKLEYSINKKDFNRVSPNDKVFDNQREKFTIKKDKSVTEIIILGEDRSGNTVLKTLSW